jgi:hypothetical protein
MHIWAIFRERSSISNKQKKTGKQKIKHKKLARSTAQHSAAQRSTHSKKETHP